MPTPLVVIITGDLVEQEVDAIVNAANNDLQLGGGVAGAIRRAGGPSIQDECDAHGPVEVGEAAITGGGTLRARYVIHAASMSLGGRTTRSSLRSSMDHVFRLAQRHDVHSIAVPAVGTGIAGFPIDECGRIMAESLGHALSEGWQPTEVRFVIFSDEPKHAFEAAFWPFFPTLREQMSEFDLNWGCIGQIHAPRMAGSAAPQNLEIGR
ncbi:MAG TPA: macro domain-containing protein [Candidatus Dormibacteraeota bacterium]|jgi:O-acetyl-ADP-ribose deacetylase (regulator of RNase III)|nr:macro domain-containing protein [Candidatus Dormibacteraeota bacterium]HEX2681169.1 macro domain-containing protein [Candidatus Dormibacteraeota bacterium]